MRTFLLSALLLVAPSAFAADWIPADVANITLDASVVHEATPDLLNLSVTCDIAQPATRIAIRELSREYIRDFTMFVGDNATIRRNGPPSIYVNYTDPLLPPSELLYSGTMSFGILNIKPEAATRIADSIEEKGCNYTWDARLLYTTSYARKMKEELMEQIEEKQAFTEELLGIKLHKVSYMSFSTSFDYGSGDYGASAGSYDPETNTIQAMTTLSVTFDIGTAKPIQ